MKLKKYIFIFGIITSSLLILELISRKYIGLGTPALYESYEGMEYKLKANQNIRRFGNAVIINNASMRTTQNIIKKKAQDKKRILIFGDSVLWGGTHIDQEKIATSLLIKKIKNKYEIYNISAGSWGPGNWIEYIKENGLFDADKVIFLINSQDLVDIPYKGNGINKQIPTSNPPFAMLELINRYLFPRAIKSINTMNNKFISFKNKNVNNIDDDLDSNINEGIEFLNEVIDLVQKNRIELIAIQFWNKEEFESESPMQFHSKTNEILTKKNIKTIQTLEYFKKCSSNGKKLFRDGIHPTIKGQICLAKVLEDAVYF
ncbi:hypothetical protein HA147_06915 [Prochlorococcus marinus XMU1410]|uniref:hypothetical protein n=1 Tax=Prochlorococcus marinus TaxID=1219 RepID=UPI001AD9A3CA|nr:hypothetical protein [Prochlorococcus marinus]MBO8242380.1 hypothetical protein [Prochlorococcus marinus XMU1410]MBW3053528.1 hypothetical protein [Prochlorococcus marinus str. MU1410]